MVNNEALNTIIKNVLGNQLCLAVEHLENYLFTFTQPQALEQLEELKADYQLMSDYWQRGFDDPQREQLYGQLLRRMYVISAIISITAVMSRAFITIAGQHGRIGQWPHCGVIWRPMCLTWRCCNWRQNTRGRFG